MRLVWRNTMINIGIIGAGRIGQVHARSIVSGVPGARVAMVADPYIKPEVKQWMEGIGAKVVSDYHDILNCKDIDQFSSAHRQTPTPQSQSRPSRHRSTSSARSRSTSAQLRSRTSRRHLQPPLRSSASRSVSTADSTTTSRPSERQPWTERSVMSSSCV